MRPKQPNKRKKKRKKAQRPYTITTNEQLEITQGNGGRSL
jgi:hypothetical protein